MRDEWAAHSENGLPARRPFSYSSIDRLARRTARQWWDGELLRQRIELRQHRGQDRHAVARPLGLTLPAALAGQADGVDPRQHLRVLEIAQMPIDLGLERLQRQEARDIERHHELARVGLAGEV